MWKSAISAIFVAFILMKLHFRFMSIGVDKVENEYDIIIVGGGTTGSVIANRLTENHNYKVLLLEAGSESIYDPFLKLLIFNVLNPGRWVDWMFETENMKPYSEITENHVSNIVRGKTLGGSSAVNFQLYSRGSPQDYDSWARQGGEGWQFDKILAFFKKSETSQHIYPINEDYHGKNGPLKVNHQEKLGFTDTFIKAFQELGITPMNDHNSGNIIGAGAQQTTVHKGMRQSSAQSYLYPIAHSRKDRLHIVVEAHVTKVNFAVDSDGRTVATGVEFSKHGKKKNVTAQKEVILSAGTFGTPQILMLSGIGPKKELRKHGISVVQDLQGVGQNYQDHIFLPVPFYANNISYGDVITTEQIVRSFPEWLIHGRGPIGVCGMAVANFKVGNSSLGHGVPDIQAVLIPAETSSQLHKILTDGFDYRQNIFRYDQANAERGGVLFSFYIYAVLLHPKSSGAVSIRSRNPFDKPIIKANVYSNSYDVKAMIEGIKEIVSLENTDAFKLKQAKFVNILKTCDDTVKDDNFYECLLRSESQLYHGCCTAKIGRACDKFAVVDSQLRVYGVHRLRVADASIMPGIVSGPLQATCFMIGEKAASLILESHT